MKKNKVFNVITSLALVFTPLTGCGSDPVADDLTNYVNNQMPAIVKLQESFITILSSINESTDVQTMISKLNEEIIPSSDKLIEEAKKIVPKTEKVKALHNKYISAMTKYNSGFVKMLEDLEKANDEMVNNRSKITAEANSEHNAYVEELHAFGKNTVWKLNSNAYYSAQVF